ncbi:MAG: 50S ribosomal protein L32 [Chloroflexi bacterium]|nr:50S ribosomal protein L32 [Chloroflexota bacterium]
MPPLPKHKSSKARTRKRRSHMALTVPVLVACPQCHSPRPSHQVCPVCGSYRGRQAIAVEKVEAAG